MKFLSDENIPRSIVVFLRKKGHNVKDIQEDGLRSLADENIIELAQKEKRVIITYDKDFIISPENPSAPSIILLRFPKIHPKDVIPYLNACIDSIISLETKLPFVVILSKESMEIVRPKEKN